MRTSFVAICAAIIAVLTCRVARAAIVTGVSIEALTCQAELPLHVKLTRVEITTEGASDVFYYHCTANVLEILNVNKTIGKTVTFTFTEGRDRTQPLVTDWLNSKNGLLVFLTVNRGQDDVRLAYQLTPLRVVYGPAIFDLSNIRHAYDRHFHFVTGATQLLQLVRTTAKALDGFLAAHAGEATTKSVALPMSAEIYKELWDGSVVGLVVPSFAIPDAKHGPK